MESDEKNQNEIKKLGGGNYLNKNCWLIKNLNYAPYKRCQYCELKFRNCFFLQYQVVSLFLMFLFFSTFLLVEKRLSLLAITTVFTFVIVYGYFFNKSTESIIKTNFFLKKTKNDLKDLTDNLEKKVDEQTRNIKEKNIKLEKLLKVQSEFLDISSHQLRTPISVIKGTAAMLAAGDMDNLSEEKKKEFYRGVYDKGLKLEKIINGILWASEFDSIGFSINDGSPEIAPEDVIDSAVKEARMEAEQRKIDLIWQKPATPLPKIRGEKNILIEAIGNLLSNALKYTPSTIQIKEARNKREKKGIVRVEAKKEKDDILIKVSDNGIGIPKKEIGKLFAKFARAKNATEMYTDGSGLGLFIVKEIVNGHRGKIWLESVLGKGSTFYISLPIVNKKQ
ncbi:MAG: HAMP domain-containing sensor histidine kinase [Patescibacteria group bacterium]